MLNLRLPFIILCFCLPLLAQTENSPEYKQPLTSQQESIEVLNDLLTQIESLDSPNSSPEQGVDETTEARERLQLKFDELVAGKESLDYFSNKTQETNIQDELVEIFDPLIGEIKNATSNSREKDFLRNQIELLLQRKTVINSALERIRILIKAAEKNPPTNTPLLTKLRDLEKVWSTRKEQADLEYESAKLQLEEKESNSTNAVETASRTIAKFFKNRGLHLLIAIFSATLVFCLLQYGYRYFIRYSPFHQQDTLKGASKTLDGLVHLLTTFLTAFTILLSFFLCDDWVLLSASLLIIVGIIWALKDRLTGLTEEIRLILNIGSVREGERIFFEGLPWRVEKIRIYSKLENPELDGGVTRIPIHSMIGLRSRPSTGKDRFFPTSTNDWVKLSDGTFGKILRQSPEFVELIKLGGARKTYPTQGYLALNPENLSISQFRISSTFGIDYRHQASVTGEIREQLQTFIKNGIIEEIESQDHLKRLNVEFSNAGASSLDFIILADFSSSLAPKYNILQRMLQRLSVEACNEYGWEIPFNQLTLHQAES